MASYIWLATFLLLLSASYGFHIQRASGRMTPSMLFNSPKSTKINIPKDKKICVITGTTSGLGKETARSLLNTGDYYVICACRNVEAMKEVAAREGFDPASHTVLPLDLGSFESTRAFVKKLQSIKNRPLDRLVCNAAVYQPALLTVSPSTLQPHRLRSGCNFINFNSS